MTKWLNAKAEFTALGEPVPIPAHPELTNGRRQQPVHAEIRAVPRPSSGVGSSGGHAGNGFWWSDPEKLFTLKFPNVSVDSVVMSEGEAVALARWILSIADAKCDACKNTDPKTE